MFVPFAALAVAFVTGLGIVLAIAPRLRGAALGGAATLAGIGAAAATLFALSVSGVVWTRTSLATVLFTVAAGAGFVAFRRRGDSARAPWQADGVALALDGLTLAACASYAVFALRRPLYEWDYFGIWGLKARVFLDAGGIDWAFLERTPARGDYPLLAPLGFDFMSLAAGAWSESAVSLLHVALGGALVAVIRGLATAEGRSQRGAAAISLVAAFPSLNLWIGLAEPAVTVFGCAGVLLVRHGLRSADRSAVSVGALFLGFAAWSKNEGLALIAVTLLCVVLTTGRVREALRLWPAVAVAAPWLFTRAMLDLPTDFLQGGVASRVLARLGDPAGTLVAFAKGPPDQRLFWLVAAGGIAFCFRAAWRQERFLTGVVLLQGALFAAQALATRWDFRAHVSLTMNRLPHQIAPLVAFLAAVLLLEAMRRKSPDPNP